METNSSFKEYRPIVQEGVTDLSFLKGKEGVKVEKKDMNISIERIGELYIFENEGGYKESTLNIDGVAFVSEVEKKFKELCPEHEHELGGDWRMPGIWKIKLWRLE